LYNEQGNSVFPYKLRIAGGTPARNIKKGHMIFKLSGENTEKCKAWYEPENKNDVAYPGQKPVIHMDDIGKLNSQETYRAQLVITYTGTEDDKEEKFYSMANLELHPDKSDNRRHIIIQKSLGEGYTREIRIKKLINNCQELN